jgi:hypothetical protein
MGPRQKCPVCVPTRVGKYVGEYVYFDYEELPVRNWFTRAYDLVAGRAPSDPEPLAHVALPLMLSSIPEDELFQLLEDLSKRHGFALELAGSRNNTLVSVWEVLGWLRFGRNPHPQVFDDLIR